MLKSIEELHKVLHWSTEDNSGKDTTDSSGTSDQIEICIRAKCMRSCYLFEKSCSKGQLFLFLLAKETQMAKPTTPLCMINCMNRRLMVIHYI